jgi:hypothetical protein
MKHTPGPWTIEYSELHQCFVVSPVDSAYVISGMVGIAANARLIAAAPDLKAEHEEWGRRFASALLAALQDDLTEIKDLARTLDIRASTVGPYIHSPAIAKAEGE